MGLGLNHNKYQKEKNISDLDKKLNKKLNIYNDSNPMNASHKEGIPTNFNLSAITLEDCDQAVWQEFNQFFHIDDKDLTLFSGDAETSSLAQMYAKDFDIEKGFIRWPMLIFTRIDTKKMYRTSPAFKQVLFQIPKLKPQGVVIEEYISEGPINYQLTYDFKFITYFRESCNDFEQQLNYYFRNKSNCIVCSNEKFTIRPENPDNICTIEMLNKDDAANITYYVATVKLKLFCWTRRGILDMQKRERPNSYTLNFTIKDNLGNICNNSKENINIEQITYTEQYQPTEKILTDLNNGLK